MVKKALVEEVANLLSQGYSEAEIIAYLRDQGYSSVEIEDALNQAKITLELAKTAGETLEEVPEPSQKAQFPEPREIEQAPASSVPSVPSASFEASTEASVETIEEIAEEVINEKWREFKAKVGDITEMKAHFETRLNELSERVKRLEIALDKLQAAMLSKVESYGRSVKTLTSEVETLESTLGKVLQPLVGSVKELKELTKEMKKGKKKGKKS